MKLLIFDNYDSFTWNLVHMAEKILHEKVDVCLNDQVSMEEIRQYDKIILSPGPGLPAESGMLLPLIREYAANRSILGVCLGHQAIAEAFGGSLENLDEVFHGVSTQISITDPGELLFRGIESEATVGRYHSWTVSSENLPDCLKVTAIDAAGRIMAMRHEKYDLRSVQFHPESIMTPKGESMLANWLLADRGAS